MNNDWQRLLRNHPWTWGLPLGLLVVSLAFFLFYQVAYAGRVEALQDRFESEQAELEQRTAHRRELASYLDRAKASRGGIRSLYLDHFQTAAERQTTVHAEMLKLASAAGLEPSSLSFPADPIGDFELRQMGINFRVDGTYEQLRNFINLLELSDQFLTLRQVTLNSSGRGASPRLSITISASTVFVTRALARRAAAARARENGATESDEPTASTVDPGADTSDEEADGEGAITDEMS